jgi:hypothetical protein
MASLLRGSSYEEYFLAKHYHKILFIDSKDDISEEDKEKWGKLCEQRDVNQMRIFTLEVFKKLFGEEVLRCVGQKHTDILFDPDSKKFEMEHWENLIVSSNFWRVCQAIGIHPNITSVKLINIPFTTSFSYMLRNSNLESITYNSSDVYDISTFINALCDEKKMKRNNSLKFLDISNNKIFVNLYEGEEWVSETRPSWWDSLATYNKNVKQNIIALDRLKSTFKDTDLEVNLSNNFKNDCESTNCRSSNCKYGSFMKDVISDLNIISDTKVKFVY